MQRLRAAIMDCVREDFGMIGELTGWTEELVEAFNEAGPFPGHPEVEPITSEDIETAGAFE